MKEIHEIIQRYTKYYDIYPNGNSTFILLYLPYRPFKKFPKDHAVIDSYYLSSNKIYHLKVAIEKHLGSYNVIKPSIPYKNLFLESGIGILLKNGLISIPPFGTRVVLEAIEINQPIEIERNQNNRLYSKQQQDKEMANCEACLKCIFSCPSKALSQSDFHFEKCIRFLMDDPYKNHETLVSLKANFLGCEICQNVCPHNKDIEKIDVPNALLKELNIEKLIENSKKGKVALEPLASFIGQNYNRPLRINKLAQIAKEIACKNSKKS